MPTSPIVCAVDFAEPSDRALEHAIALAKSLDAPVLAAALRSLLTDDAQLSLLTRQASAREFPRTLKFDASGQRFHTAAASTPTI